LRRFDVKTNTPSKVIKLREWSSHWAIMKPYNGFTHDERVRGWAVLWYLRDLNIVVKYPKNCSICNSADGVNYHGENYYAPELVFAICKGCHIIIHKRFNRPEPFCKLVQEYSVSSNQDSWFTQLKLTPINLAGELRTKFGEKITDLPQGLRDRGLITAEDCELLRASL
jgi:hypothetical protein